LLFLLLRCSVEDFGAVGEKFETEDRQTKVVCGGIKD
jgi:hypothetical protein